MHLSTSTFILLYFVLFLIGAMIGYGIEVLFRRFFSAKKWVNPGFLAGPWLPLYGFGVIAMFSFSLIFINLLPADMPLYNPIGNFEGRAASGPTVYDLIPIATMAVSLITLEFVAGIIFVKGFKVRLWDYTNMKGNIMGVICPVFNIIWCAVAVLYYYGLSPFIYEAAKQLALYLFGDETIHVMAHSSIVFVIGILYGFFIIDLVKSLNLFHKVRELARVSGIIERYEQLKAKQKELSAISAAKLYEKIPEPVKKKLEEIEDSKRNKKPSKFKTWLNKLILIDPNKEKTTNNYDESGRPIHEDESAS